MVFMVAPVVLLGALGPRANFQKPDAAACKNSTAVRQNNDTAAHKNRYSS